MGLYKKTRLEDDEIDIPFLGSVHLMEGNHKFNSELSSVKKHRKLHKGWKTQIPTVAGR